MWNIIVLLRCFSVHCSCNVEFTSLVEYFVDIFLKMWVCGCDFLSGCETVKEVENFRPAKRLLKSLFWTSFAVVSVHDIQRFSLDNAEQYFIWNICIWLLTIVKMELCNVLLTRTYNLMQLCALPNNPLKTKIIFDVRCEPLKPTVCVRLCCFAIPSYVYSCIQPVACRSPVLPGANAWLYGPVPGVQWDGNVWERVPTPFCTIVTLLENLDFSFLFLRVADCEN